MKLQTTSISSSSEVVGFSGTGAVQGPTVVHCSSCHSSSASSAFTCLHTQGTDVKFHKGFCGSPAIVLKTGIICPKKSDERMRLAPRAVLVAPTESSQEHVLDGGLQLKAKATGARLGSPALAEFQISNCYLSSPVLHWGLTRPGKRSWSRPSKWPEGTRDFQNQALQTPFRKSGDIAFLTIEIFDTKFDAIEFILRDDSSDLWLKLHGGNFRLVVPEADLSSSTISIPEELVQVQAYLRWERKGKQQYSADQEAIEYEEARKELQEEIARGVSLEALQAKLLRDKVSDEHSNVSEISKPSISGEDIPDDLVQVQSFVRWEKAGKPTLTTEEQLKEFEEARKDLEKELQHGETLKGLYKRLLPNAEIDTKKGAKGVGKQRKRVKARIQRKQRDASELINFSKESPAEPATPISTREATALERAVEVIEKQDIGAIVQKKLFKLGGSDLLVLVTNPGEELHIRFASDEKNPLILHWAVSKNSVGEWQIPPESIIPSDSTLLNISCETPFIKGFTGDSSLQSLQMVIKDTGIIGIPFVLRSGDAWIKDNGSDFYISLMADKKSRKVLGDDKRVSKWFLEEIARCESDAERSLMHRFNIATELTEKAKNAGRLPLVGILVWMRFMATRQLTWNRNYNVKPREISAAQDRLTDLLQGMFKDQPADREIIRLIMSTVGRGGQGDVGQRIRDEILVIQRKNDCKGAMMEEWHQKLHNNTSPDDVVICQALLDYIKHDLNIEAYWSTLNSNGVTKERLASYDRPIVSEPRFRPDQKEGLMRDLTAYLRTLKAVHSGADLESSIATCMGYSSEGQGFMGGVKIDPIAGLSSDLPGLLEFVLDHVEDKEIIPLLEGLVESRRELQPSLLKAHARLRDIIFLDLSLDSTVRTAVERGLESLSSAPAADIIYVITMVLESLCLSSQNNEELVFCLKEWCSVLQECKSGHDQWPLRAKAVLDRTRLSLADKAEQYHEVLQPSADQLGALLGVEQWAIDIFTEEIIRAGSAASLSQLLNRLDPVLRAAAHLGSWQIISPVEVHGYVAVVDNLGDVQDKVYERPTILVAKRVKGEEEIPDGAVALLTPDMPDVLSHVSVRARNAKVCFATCFDDKVLSDLQAKDGILLKLQPTSSDLVYSEISKAEISSSGESSINEEPAPVISLKKKTFCGRFAVAAKEFNHDLVGAKSRNIANLKSELPSWIKVPTSIAIPFGVFETVLLEEMNKDVAREIRGLNDCLKKGDFSKLHDIRRMVLQLQAPSQLVEDLKLVMKSSNMPWPGDEGQQRWEQAWTAIKKVWASKWNERAYFSCRKAKIDHNDLCMAVLVQEIVRADYAFVIHTTNPSSGDSSEIYAEVVKGLGETLVGAYSGRALSFLCKKTDLKSPKISGFPSKRIGLFIKQSIIFRSDSNGEDLEGFAGAGLYDSVPMDQEEERVVDYSSDPLIVDDDFQRSILSKIAEAGASVEELYGSAQDIEGVIKEGELYLVQTRPQM